MIGADDTPFRRFLLDLRAAFLWVISVLHFAVAGTFVVLLGFVVDPRRNDRPLRVLARNVLRLAGARFSVRRDPGFDAQTPSFFVCNHVNVFDAFVIYSAIPQFVRGLELESHFHIPVYGWMARRFGNVPVPAARTPSAVRAMKERCRLALDDGISIIAFPEGHRTRTGDVGLFHAGVFRMAKEFGVPIVPMSVVGSFELKRPQSWRLRPARIVVHLHETIRPESFADSEERALAERAREAVRGPIEAARRANPRPAASRTDP